MMDSTVTSFMQLVVGLTPPGRRCPSELTTAPRERSVLLSLAYLADQASKDGVCSASVRDLSAMTHHRETSIRVALRNLERGGWIVGGDETCSTRTYWLQRDTLVANQLSNLFRRHDRVELLGDYGLSARAVSALVGDTEHGAWSSGYSTLSELGEAVAAYRNLAPSQQHGFHKWLAVRSVGEALASEILTAYDAWAVDQQQVSA